MRTNRVTRYLKRIAEGGFIIWLTPSLTAWHMSGDWELGAFLYFLFVALAQCISMGRNW